MRIQIYHIPNVKKASKYPLSNNNNADSMTKYGVLGRLDVQIVAVHPLKGHRWGTGQKRCPARARRAPGALTLPLNHRVGPYFVGQDLEPAFYFTLQLTLVYPSGLLVAGTSSANPSVTQGQGFEEERASLGGGGGESSTLASGELIFHFWFTYPLLLCPVWPRAPFSSGADISTESIRVLAIMWVATVYHPVHKGPCPRRVCPGAQRLGARAQCFGVRKFSWHK